MSRPVRRDKGASQAVMIKVRTAPITARTPTGTRMRLREMPREVMAMISLSMDMRPRPRRTPMRTAMGMVKTRTLGTMQRKRTTTW